MILVLVGHARSLVGDIAGIVLDHKACLAKILVVSVGRASAAQTLHEGAIGLDRVGVRSGTGVVHDTEDTRLGLLLFDQIAHDLVVEKINLKNESKNNKKKKVKKVRRTLK